MTHHEMAEAVIDEVFRKVGAGWNGRELASFMVGMCIESFRLAQVTAEEYGINLDALIEEHDAQAVLLGSRRREPSGKA